jgi:hypothetical protein
LVLRAPRPAGGPEDGTEPGLGPGAGTAVAVLCLAATLLIVGYGLYVVIA